LNHKNLRNPLLRLENLKMHNPPNKVNMTFLSSLCTAMAYTSVLRSTDFFRINLKLQQINHMLIIISGLALKENNY